MDLSFYIYAVAAAAVVYGFIAREIQNRMVDKKEMEEIQKESKRLSSEYKDATKAGDKTRMDKIMAEQMALLPRMNKMMLNQFKPMIVILILFAGFTYVVNYFDPSVQDDITLNMTDGGGACDIAAGDGIYTACYQLSGENYGKWTVAARALNGGAEVGKNATIFYYGQRTEDNFVDRTNANMAVSTDKEVYGNGDTIVITAKPPETAHSVLATVSNGTQFSVELPFAIPLINVKTIYQPYWWFIFISLVFSLGYSFIIGKIKK